MKKILSIIVATVIISSAAYAQVSTDIADKCYKIMQESQDIQAYHGDYSATLSLVVEKPGKPKENIQYKIFQRTDAKLMTIVQLFPDADKGQTEENAEADVVNAAFHGAVHRFRVVAVVVLRAAWMQNFVAFLVIGLLEENVSADTSVL